MVYKENAEKDTILFKFKPEHFKSNNRQRTKLKANEHIKSLLLKQNDLKAKVK